jgi:hypothetical protein
MNRDYSTGKVYKIVADTDEEYKPYVGSTVQGLAERMGGHRRTYNYWKEGKSKQKIASYDLFERFGIENCKIILLEEYSCDNKMKLLMKEREWFDKIECCNKAKPIRTKEEENEYSKEYRNKNKELLVQKSTNYRNENKEEIKGKRKIHYEVNKEILLEKATNYRESNKEIINEKAREKITCNCGSIYNKGDKARHERSLKHQNYLSSLKV